MFSLLWRFVPGPVWLRILVLLVVAAALVWALLAYVYPLTSMMLVPDESTVGG